MDQILKQSTAVTIPFGPIYVEGTGIRWEGSGLASLTVAGVADSAAIIAVLDHADTGILLSKNGGSLTIREQGANFVATTYDTYGCFKVHLSAIDTNTLGRIRVIYSTTSTYLPVSQDFMIVPAQVFESFFGADRLDVTVAEMNDIDFGALQKASITSAVPTTSDIKTAIEIAGGSIALTKAVTDALTVAGATKIALSASTIISAAAAAGTLSTTQMTTTLTEATNNHYNGRIIIWTSGVLINQATAITGYNGVTKMLTFTTITEAPTAADTFIIV